MVLGQQEKDTVYAKLKKNLLFADSKEDKVNALLKLSRYQMPRNSSESEEFLLQARKIINSGTFDDKAKRLAEISLLLGNIYYKRSNYVEAVSNYLNAKKIFEELRDTIRLASVLNNIGVVHRYQKENDKAIQYYKRAAELAEKIKDTFIIAASNNMMGVSYRKLKKLDSALLCYNRAIELYSAINSEKWVRSVRRNLVTLYVAQKKFDKSLPIRLEQLAYVKKEGNSMSLATNYYNVSRDYFRAGDFEKSLKYADSSLRVAQKLGYKDKIARAFLRKSNTYKSMSNFKEAYNNHVNYKIYQDSVYNVENVKKIQKLELKYEFDKQKEVLELQTKQQESKTQLYIFLFFSLLIAGGTVGYLLYRNYTARARIVREKLEKEKLKKELLREKVKVSESELKSLVADNSMRLTFIQELSQQIKGDKKESNSKEIQKYTQSLLLRLQQQIATESKLSSIQDRVKEINRGFDEKIMAAFPNLTKTEREICSLLRVNLSIKEIASIRNATTDSVKALRYRIRKKLQVPNTEELEHFIQSL